MIRRSLRADIMNYFALGLISIVVAASAQAQDTAAVSGCYSFDRAYFQWVGRRPGESAVVTDSTSVIRLSSGSEIKHQLVRGPVLDVFPIPFAADSRTVERWLSPSNWTFENANTVNVVWRNGLYGPVFRLNVRGDTLRGQVRFTTDVAGAEPPPEPALALKVACPHTS